MCQTCVTHPNCGLTCATADAADITEKKVSTSGSTGKDATSLRELLKLGKELHYPEPSCSWEVLAL